MANWNEIRASVGRVANKALRKTEELADTASMHLKLKNLENKREETYAALGRLTYRQLKTEGSRAEEIAKKIEEIDHIRQKINVVKDEIEAAKKAKEAQKAQQKAEEAAEKAARKAAEAEAAAKKAIEEALADAEEEDEAEDEED
ncbi:MAG: hypothetical protein IJY47_06460 [Clostridia bacterium]|nr:hypothetical protein [Clostridia bacterium]